MGVEEGPPIVKAASNKRSYRLIKLRNGLAALLIHDPDVNDFEEEEEEEEDIGDVEVTDVDESVMQPDFLLDWPHFQSNCSGLDGEDSMSAMKLRLRFHPDEEGGPRSSSLLNRFKQEKLLTRFKHDKYLNRFKGKQGKENVEPEQELTNKNAAAGICVGVGSMADPPDAPGLAHYLECGTADLRGLLGLAEHMLFMGCTKFQDENEYDKFLSRHGGSSNAWTEQEFTSYYFEVRNRRLRGALERFSQFFISPLVKVDAMDREIKAIESEFVQAAGNDMNRLSQVQCHTALPTHPYHRFSWGNRKSLQSEPAGKGIDMRAKLLQLYHENYRAGRMKLVILGGDSLDTLQKWVVALFAEVKEGGQGRLPIHAEGRIWEPNRLYRVAAGTEQSLVSINFPLPCLESAYLTKPHDYLGHIIGHEGRGSLLSLLGCKGWGISISAGCGDRGFEANSIIFLFTVTITLTVRGAEHVLEVIAFVFQYLKMVRSVGPQEWIFEEQKVIGRLNFEYYENPAPDEYAISLATNMHIYPEVHIMYGDYAHDVWNPDMVTELLSQLTPDNMRVDVLLHDFDRKASDVQTEPWFETPFKVETIPLDVINLWTDPPSVDPALHLPERNEFVPHDFTLVTSTANASKKNPSCLIDSAALKVWHKCNMRFNTPRINACFSIMYWPATKQISDAVLAQMYLLQLVNILSETRYLADVAKLESSITLSGYRIEIKIFGFSEKLPVLAQKIVSHMKTLPATQLHFERIVEVLSEDYKRANGKPIDHAAYLLTQALSKRFWDVDHRYDCLQSLTFQDFTKFVDNLFSKTYIECLIEGNAVRKQALAIAKTYKEALVRSPLPLEARPANYVVKLQAGTSLLYKENCKSEFERNSVVQSYFQIGQDQGKNSIRLRCLILLFEDIISEPFFNQLRTKEQLGYVVQSECEDLHGVLGISFMVQSEKYSPAYVEARINDFIKQIPKLLKSMRDDEFQAHKESLIADKQGLPCSLLEESEGHWEQIWRRRYMFDAHKHQAAMLKTVTKKDLINWCRRFLGARSRMRRHLCIHVVGVDAQNGAVLDPKTETPITHSRKPVLIDSLDEFKRNLQTYPAKL